MHGHGYPQPVKQPPHPAWLVVLRVLFVVLGIFTIGLFSWAMLLRLALVTRRALDWGLFVASLLAVTLGLVLIGVEPGDEIHTAGGWTGMALLFGTLVATIAYYLSADVRHFHQLRYAGYAPQPAPAPAPAPAYGYPQPHLQPPLPQSPYTATTVPQAPSPAPQPHLQSPMPQPPAPHTPPPAPQRPAPARIDQVRAELDELSDYLRRQDGQPGGNHEGGR
ncbi:hypothetical protein SAMN06272735_3486 [Streptomyces sp. TLI_55]|uniref:hypothetical protein n=1 Tax=Streptomyces sp. TLI_55 TaxID=1938861 RepID=UPI000BCDA9BA|nr:hypothetical protein [Streptomyces sp. TLI_55]SNX61739.1 hypothetical protein SAMN06272735_3486 [Streptomyces sp. TLI_55]